MFRDRFLRKEIVRDRERGGASFGPRGNASFGREKREVRWTERSGLPSDGCTPTRTFRRVYWVAFRLGRERTMRTRECRRRMILLRRRKCLQGGPRWTG